ncbi:hypothetical protein MACH26_06330 [Planctobacterium marinum]|uniref:Integral membrane protein n=2 Tax=Planctobacterium marinum TaxID=1631968 RepID=A0AA48HMB9_9ALTE|nr:hypothetical protein MACH26_06330 [Planctobacterium marinum]
MGTLALFCLSIAIIWAFVGAWLILPFAGLEVGLLLFLTWLVSKSTYQRQIVLLSPQYISLQKGYGKRLQGYLFEYSQSYLITYEPRHPEDTLELLLRDNCKSVPVAEFLNLEDQQLFIKLLQKEGVKLHKVKPSIAIDC